MILPLKWLRDYIEIDISAEKFADQMTLTGTKSERVEHIGEAISGVVVGKITEITKHPDADKLIVTQVDVGEEVKQIVTGANNIKVGDYVPVAMHGAKLPDGTKIKRGKMRGVVSDGMLCSAGELGIDSKFLSEEQKNGLYVLEGELVLGQDIRDVLDLKDAIIEFELTANRPDCNSIIGIAYEAKATLDKEVTIPTLKVKEEGANIGVDVKCENNNLCGRYMAREITDVKIAPSPYYIQRRLIESGIRPINNIVDLTNYVMLEYGQPMHAFDYDKLEGNTIYIKQASDGQTCVTLDEEERKLDSSMITICDSNQVIALGGVMGASCSQIDEHTTHIVLESAHFDADTIRATSKKLGLRTDASARFEKGIDRYRCEKALNRFCQLVEELEIGTVCKGFVDTATELDDKSTVTFSKTRVSEVIGIELSSEEICDILSKLNFESKIEGDLITTVAPEYRTDIEKIADIIEEISRIYGFNNVVSAPIVGEIIPATKSESRLYEDSMKEFAMKNGLTEILTYSFVSPIGVEKAKLSETKENDFVKLLNPLGEETSVMRTSLIPNMLEVISMNAARKNEFFAGFEFGNIFCLKQSNPLEQKSFVAGVYGKEEDFFSLKGRIEGILNGLRYQSRVYLPNKEHPTFHPGRCADIFIGEEKVGILGEIHPKVASAFNIKKKVYLCELNIPTLMSLFDNTMKYRQIPKFPAMKRDIALVVDKNQYVSEIEQIICKNGKSLIEKIELFDIYEGDQIEKDKKSVAYSVVYRNKEATLTDEEVNSIQEKILKELEEKLHAVLR